MQTLLFSMMLRVLRAFVLVSAISIPAQAISFKNPPIIPTSTDVAEMATADVNSDGKLDLVYVDGTGPQFALHILLGKGDGTFTHGQDISLPAGVCCALTVGDVTGDGKPDIVLAGFSVASNGQITVLSAVLVGNGDGTFQAVTLSTFQPTNVSLYPVFRSAFAIGDINGDGKADLALLDRQNAIIYTLIGNNTGSFVPGVIVQSSTRDEVHLLDLKGDGHLDILTTDSIGAQFEVFLGKGDGTFPTFSRYSLTTSAGPFFLIDVNGDGRPDVLTPYYAGLVGYFKNNGDGTFSNLVPLGASPSSNLMVAAGDLNGDGILDLTFLTPSGIAVSLGTSGPTFAAPLTTISGGSTSPYSTLPTTPVAGDFNGDGHMDLAIAVEGGIELLFGKGDGTFASADFYDLAHTVGGAAVADFKGDTFEDIAVTVDGTFPRLLLGDGSGKFTLAPDQNTGYSLPSPDVTLLAADFNGDAKPDLNLGNMVLNQSSAGTQSIAYNLGNGLFTAPVSIPNSSPVLADFNRDGRMDMLQTSGQQIIVSLGESNNSFTTVATTLHQGAASGFFNVGDMNNDGKPDLVLNYFDHLEVWLGNGDGTFTYATSIDIQNVVNDVIAVVADVDGDGNADIILAPDSNPAGRFGPLAIFYGNRNGTFQAPVYLPISRRYSQITIADLNRDNRPDMVMTDGAAIAVMMNLGNRTFDSEVDFIAGRAVSALNVVDVNSDGYPDIVVANPGGTTVTVLLNQPNGNSSQGAPISGTLSVAPEPSVGTQPFTIAITVSSQTSGGITPTGTVGFSLDGAFLANVQLANGSASYNFSGSLIPIQHAVTAAYSGDSSYASRIFSVSHTVQPPTYATQTVLTATPSVVLASQTVRLAAQVTGAVPIPSGVVTFLDGSASLGSASISSSGIAYFDTALLGPGVHSLAVKFQGFTQYGFNFTTAYVAAIFSPSTSSPATILVNTDATSTTLSGSATSPTAGTVVAFTANVGSAAGVPFGGATFYDGSSILGTSSLKADGTSTYSTASLSAGAHSITAAFNANGPFAGSTSAPVSISVLAAPATAIATIVSLDPEANPSDNSSTLVANVSAPKGAPTGIVTFLDSGTILGTAVTNQSGLATLRVGTLGSGFHSFTASFAGASEFAPGASPALYDQWPETGPGFTVTLGARTLSVTSARSQLLQISIEPLSAFQQQVQLSCTVSLPEGYDCTFSPGTLNGGGVSILKIQRIATSAQGSARMAPLYGLAFGVLSFALLGSLTQRSRGLFLLVICCSLSLLSGCGTTSSPVDHTQRLVLTIRAESGAGPQMIVHSTQVTLIMPSTK